MANIDSPCVRNCCLDTNDICLGCFRSIEEIMRWASIETTLSQKQQILSNANKRKQDRQLFYE
ncbi:MAG: DUF1289 domain-containing protein [Piscirickettsiaceae bacterium]|nr:DUF1289 domain-containing protein [Piscirickettsiaceae bacterium]